VTVVGPEQFGQDFPASAASRFTVLAAGVIILFAIRRQCSASFNGLIFSPTATLVPALPASVVGRSMSDAE